MTCWRDSENLRPPEFHINPTSSPQRMFLLRLKFYIILVDNIVIALKPDQTRIKQLTNLSAFSILWTSDGDSGVDGGQGLNSGGRGSLKRSFAVDLI